MPIPDASREDVVAAMDLFDAELRDSDAWRGWEGKGNFRYAVVRDGKRYPVKEVVAQAAGVSPREFSGGEEANGWLRRRGFEVVDLRPGDDGAKPAPSWWWVNQGATYAQERDGGYLWAPKLSKAGRPFSYWSNLTRLEPGDVVIHYANTAIRAVGRVEAPSVDAPRPSELGEGRWGEDGYLARVAYRELPVPLSLDEIPPEWRAGGDGPFTQQGGVKQGYLFPVDPAFAARLAARFPDRFGELPVGAADLELGDGEVTPGPPERSYLEPDFADILKAVRASGMRVDDRDVRRYHLALKTRGFVVLSGLSGTGKTWLAQAYADAVGARHLVIPVAPNWTSNEDLLGYHNPISDAYHDTPFSHFLREAADEHARAQDEGVRPRPFHLVLDEMNLARVEHYFARFLSAMEVRARAGSAPLELGPGDEVVLSPNLAVVGTVNVDETTHGFADKVYDRAQLIELGARRDDLAAHLGDAPYAADLMAAWDAVREAGPFTFRVLDEVKAYVAAAREVGAPWEEALDELLLQKVLPKLKGADPRVEQALVDLRALCDGRFPFAGAKATEMLDGFRRHGFASYFR